MMNTTYNRIKRWAVQCLVLLLALAVVFAVLYFGYCLGVCHPVWGGIVMSLALLGLGWLVLSVTHRLMMHNLSRIVAFVALFVLGLWVYQDYDSVRDEVDETVLQSEDGPLVRFFSPINNTLSIFFPSRGSYSEPNLDNRVGFHVVHFLSYLFAAMIAFSWFGRRTMNRSGYLFVPRRHRNIFWGYSEGGMLLAEDILSKNCMQQVVFVLPKEIRGREEEERRIFEQVDGMGGMVLYKDLEGMRRVPRGRRHFFLTEDQDLNMRLALKVASSVQRSARSLYVRTELPQAWTLFQDLYVEKRIAPDKQAEVHIFNQSDLTARKFVKDHAMLDCAKEQIHDLKVDYEFKVLQLGFGWTGRELLHKTICDAQYVGSTFSATVFDLDFETRNGSYRVLWEECIGEYHLDFRTERVGSAAFYEWACAHLAAYCRVVVALGDDRLNLEVGMALARIAQDLPDFSDRIFVHVREPRHFSYCSKKTTGCELFGDLATIYTEGMVIGEVLDMQAKAVNCVYSKPEEKLVGRAAIECDADAKWREASLFDRDSSRAAAAHIDNIDWLAEASGTTLAAAIHDPASLEILAETEHLRWNAFHFTKGVRLWPLGEIPEGHPDRAKRYAKKSSVSEPNSKPEKGPLLNHACLVSYAELAEVTRCVNRNQQIIKDKERVDYQENDRRIVRHFPIIKQITSFD